MKKNLLLVVLITSLIAACSPTAHIVNSWRDPEVVVNTAELHKFVVAAFLKNEAVRRRVEDRMAALYPGKAVPSYTEFGLNELKENDEVYNQKLKSEGFDGFVMMRLVKVDKDSRYVPGTYPPSYVTWRGYWRYAWPNYYDPGYYTTDKTYYVEVNVYSLLRDKLIWSGITSTINPSGGDELFDGVIKAVSKKMKDEGFLK
jgi:hypothetical protein